MFVDDRVAGHLGEGDVGAEDAQGWVTRRGTVALHVDDPRRSLIVRNAQSHSKRFTDQAWFELLGLGLILLPFVVNIPKDSKLTLRLVLKEGIMQHRVLNIDLPQFRIHPFFHLLSHHLRAIPLAKGISQFADACRLDELWQFEHGLEDTSFCLEEF